MPESETPTTASPAPRSHLVQREGRPEDALGQQLVDPKQTFLLMAEAGLGQDLKQLGVVGEGTGHLSCDGRVGTSWPSHLRAEPTDSLPQPLVTNEENTLCAQIFLLSPAHTTTPLRWAGHSPLYNHKTWARMVGAQESGLDLTPGPGCAQPALDPNLGRASLQLDGCVRRGLCPFGGQQGAAPGRPVQSLFLSQTLEWPGSAHPSQARYSDPRLSSSLTSRTHIHLGQQPWLSVPQVHNQISILSPGAPAGALTGPQLSSVRGYP